jgi:hypothetical protein
MLLSSHEIADRHNSHVRDWYEVTTELVDSDGASTDALAWLTNRANTPSLETIKYVRSAQLGMWEEVPDPNPDLTESFRRHYLPTPYELDVLLKQNPRAQLLRSPLPLYGLLNYALACYEELNTVLQSKGFAASHIIPRFNTGMFGYLEANGLYSTKIPKLYSALIARVLNHLHGTQGRIFNTDDALRGMHFSPEPFVRKWEIAQNGRYIKISGHTIQLRTKSGCPRWNQFYQLEESVGTGQFFLLKGYANKRAAEVFNSPLEVVEYFNALK